MTHKLILKVKKFQLSGAKRFGTVEEKPPGGSPPIPFRVKVRSFEEGQRFDQIWRLLGPVSDHVLINRASKERALYQVIKYSHGTT